ncbi:MAG: NADH-quinone oxidoreductase subunit A [Anaerolineaceae bacterium]
MLTSDMISQLWPMAVYFLAVIIVILGMLGISYFLGERHRGHATNDPYESGLPIIGSARQRITARFYMVAVFFVIFDLESVFVIAWAVAMRQLGWPGYLEIMIFIGVLMAALVYIWRLGVLDWGPKGRK